MKQINTFINESAINLCTFDASKFDHEELGNAFIKLGESIHAFDKAKEFSLSHYKDDEDNKFVLAIRVKDNSRNEYFKKTIKSK